jgi:hypothetical protein
MQCSPSYSFPHIHLHPYSTLGWPVDPKTTLGSNLTEGKIHPYLTLFSSIVPKRLYVVYDTLDDLSTRSTVRSLPTGARSR